MNIFFFGLWADQSVSNLVEQELKPMFSCELDVGSIRFLKSEDDQRYFDKVFGQVK